MNSYTKQGAPPYHSQRAHSHAGKRIVPRRMQSPAEIERENQMRALKPGVAIGFIASALLFGLILWLWVIPTMDGAVAVAKGMVA